MNEKRPHILLVDDDVRTLDLMAAALGQQGFDVTPAATPGSALQLIETRVFGCGAVLLRYTPRTEALGPAA